MVESIIKADKLSERKGFIEKNTCYVLWLEIQLLKWQKSMAI
jgi:hypothetical protein